MSTNLFDNCEDSDDDVEDDDYRPEDEVHSDNADHSEDHSSDEEEGYKKNKKKRTSADGTPSESEDTQKESPEELKKKSDSLWEEFRKDLPKSEKTDDTNVSTDSSTNDSSAKTLVTKTYDFAGEEVKVSEEVANSSKSRVDSNDNNYNNNDNKDTKGGPAKAVKRVGGLGNVLSQLKKPKMSTLQKSAIDWNDYKKTEGIEDELKLHNRSKDTFVERQAFLQRTDLRQFQIEKQIREKNRSQRQLNKD